MSRFSSTPTTEETFGGFLEPHIVLPEQFYSATDSKVSGELRLMLAILVDALHCYQKYAWAQDSSGRQQFNNAANWIRCRDRDWYFSFTNICEILGFDPAYLRRGLKNWRLHQQPRADGQKLAPRRLKRSDGPRWHNLMRPTRGHCRQR